MTGLKARRTAAGLTLRQIGETVGVSAQAVAKWEAGTAWPSADLLPAIAEALGCSIDDLYGDDPADAAALGCSIDELYQNNNTQEVQT